MNPSSQSHLRSRPDRDTLWRGLATAALGLATPTLLTLADFNGLLVFATLLAAIVVGLALHSPVGMASWPLLAAGVGAVAFRNAPDAPDPQWSFMHWHAYEAAVFYFAFAVPPTILGLIAAWLSKRSY